MRKQAAKIVFRLYSTKGGPRTAAQDPKRPERGTSQEQLERRSRLRTQLNSQEGALSQSKQTVFTGLNNSDGNNEAKATNLFYSDRDKSQDARSELFMKDLFCKKLGKDK